MNKITKKITAALLSLVMVLSVVTVNPVQADTNTTTAGTVTITIERLTIGQGFFMEPTQIAIKSGDTIKDVFNNAMIAISGGYTSSSDWGFYLKSIKNADTGTVNIPQEIVTMPEYKYTEKDDEGYTIESGYKPPNNIVNDGNKDTALGEGDYHTMSGWMFTLNNESIPASADQVKVKNGDVIRLQFSVYGWGADLGFDTESYTGIPKLSLANKDSLISAVAAVNANKTYWMAYPNVQSAYNSAKTVLETYNPTQEKVNAALNILRAAEQTPTYPTVARAAVSKIKNIKGRKAKITVKKLAEAKGYQYQYANNKKFKKAKVKTTTKTSITTKKFKKKQRCYVKIRAYIKVNGTKVFGKWSKKKSVKIKK